MPNFGFENQNTVMTCGLDEVGRAPLAGPVVAACVYIPNDIQKNAFWQSVNDSKNILKSKHQDMSDHIKSIAHWGIGEASVEETDDINIVQASFLAMQRAYDMMDTKCGLALIDGNLTPKTFPCATQTIVKGDTLSVSIAAASIIAKLHRDTLMKKLALQHPHYRWDKNAGYPTKQHLDGINTHGITEHHRKSFAPVKNFITFGHTHPPKQTAA